MNLENSVNQRIIEFIEQTKDGNKRQFALATGISPSNINNIIKGKSTPGFDVIYNIVKAFPDMDIKWLITGIEDESRGNKFLKLSPTEIIDKMKTYSVVAEPKPQYVIDYKEKYYHELENHGRSKDSIIELQKEIEALKEEINQLKGGTLSKAQA